MVFSPNDSPLAGREGAHLTGSKIGERLAAEAATSVSLRVVPVAGGGGEAFEVQARGELQLGLLIGARARGARPGSVPPRPGRSWGDSLNPRRATPAPFRCTDAPRDDSSFCCGGGLTRARDAPVALNATLAARKRC